MTSNQNILVKLNQAGFRLKDKWLVKGVSLQIKKGQIKGWKLHKIYKCHLAVLSVAVTFNFIDSRKDSKTYLKKDRIILSKRNYGILIVPPNIWFNFTTKNKISLVVNTLNYPHSDRETKNKLIG